ncbi:MAG: hypothetical protein GY862_31225, partial [Gammaproteobacteria bacterium]|nr:hypothetical protein [Gammaproteobacteria bacterium]
MTGIEVDADNLAYNACIQFSTRNNRMKTVIAPLHEIATRAGVVKNLTKHGAAIPESRGTLVSEFLVEYINANRDKLPHIGYTKRLGLIGKNGLAAPGGNVNTKVEYRGKHQKTVGEDFNAVLDAF